MGALAIVPTREVVPHRPEVVASRRRDDFESLWLTVIMSAVEDLFSPGSAATAQDQSDALHFLTDKVGAWAASRLAIATAAGIDPAALREHVVGILEGNPLPPGMLSSTSNTHTKNLAAGLDAARLRWSQRLATDKETLDRSRALSANAKERREKERAEAEDQRAARNAALEAQHEAALERKMEAQRRATMEREAVIERTLERAAKAQAAIGRQLKAAPPRAPRHEEFFTLTPLEIDGLPFGQIALFKQPWEFGDYCTILGTHLPNPKTTPARMLLELTQPEAVMSGDFARGEARWDGLRKIEAITGLTPIFFEPDGCPALRAQPHYKMRLRLRP